MILLLAILYAIGAFYSFIIFLNIQTSGGPSNPDWGPISRFMYDGQHAGGFVGGVVIIFNILLWPITLPAYSFKI